MKQKGGVLAESLKVLVDLRWRWREMKGPSLSGMRPASESTKCFSLAQGLLDIVDLIPTCRHCGLFCLWLHLLPPAPASSFLNCLPPSCCSLVAPRVAHC